ncbi:Rhomboid family protein [Lacunisphaera limnophila]|uniref:Rhomboid family protein n=1 Tax=Lacunisphaera limnophila TaxID=1838286 RepID=A0A1I7PHB5_9BACT|nr:rhomboid family intramembrane serine protease [Lacunisphaera limnophila]AOS42990.1 Rhomboid family protein [Lacunisphaera limnophila]
MPSDRSYMRGDYPRPPTTALVWLIAAMLATFVLQLVLLSPWLGSSSTLPDLLRLTVRNAEQGRLWILVTHGFLHSTGNPLHIIFSLLGLVLIGRELEPQLGARRFTLVFGGALVTGAFCWLALHWRTGGGYIGPSAGILGLLVVLARLYENQRMNFMPFFLFSVTMQPMHFVYGLAAIDAFLLILYELPGSPVPFGYAPSVHLGGMLAGWLYFQFLHANNGWDRAASFSLPTWLRWPRRRPPAAATPAAPARTRRATETLRADVDRILDKINSQGFGSLTAEEKRTLDDAKDLLNQR